MAARNHALQELGAIVVNDDSGKREVHERVHTREPAREREEVLGGRARLKSNDQGRIKIKEIK